MHRALLDVWNAKVEEFHEELMIVKCNIRIYLLMYVDDSTHIPGLPSVLFSITYNMQNWKRKG